MEGVVELLGAIVGAEAFTKWGKCAIMGLSLDFDA